MRLPKIYYKDKPYYIKSLSSYVNPNDPQTITLNNPHGEDFTLSDHDIYYTCLPVIGALDSDQNQLYEGDIIRTSDNKYYVIKYIDDGLERVVDDGRDLINLLDIWESFYVVGNVHNKDDVRLVPFYY